MNIKALLKLQSAFRYDKNKSLVIFEWPLWVVSGNLDIVLFSMLC